VGNLSGKKIYQKFEEFFKEISVSVLQLLGLCLGVFQDGYVGINKKVLTTGTGFSDPMVWAACANALDSWVESSQCRARAIFGTGIDLEVTVP